MEVSDLISKPLTYDLGVGLMETQGLDKIEVFREAISKAEGAHRERLAWETLVCQVEVRTIFGNYMVLKTQDE